MMTKPTDDSLRDAQRAAGNIADHGAEAYRLLYAARRLFRSDADQAALVEMRAARGALLTLRRTQTAAIENIDAAIASAEQSTQGKQ